MSREMWIAIAASGWTVAILAMALWCYEAHRSEQHWQMFLRAHRLLMKHTGLSSLDDQEPSP